MKWCFTNVFLKIEISISYKCALFILAKQMASHLHLIKMAAILKGVFLTSTLPLKARNHEPQTARIFF